MSFFNTIVVATDFSETAEEALSAALEIGRETRGRLELLNVVPDPLQQPWMVEAAGVDLGLCNTRGCTLPRRSFKRW